MRIAQRTWRALFHHKVNLVGVDLLLGGDRLKMIDPLPAGDFFAFVTRAPASHACDVYAWPVRAPLPTIPVPLKQEDGDAALELGTVFTRTYDNGRFDLVIRYSEPPPELTEADRAWASERVRSLRQ